MFPNPWGVLDPAHWIGHLIPVLRSERWQWKAPGPNSGKGSFRPPGTNPSQEGWEGVMSGLWGPNLMGGGNARPPGDQSQHVEEGDRARPLRTNPGIRVWYRTLGTDPGAWGGA